MIIRVHLTIEKATFEVRGRGRVTGCELVLLHETVRIRVLGDCARDAARHDDGGHVGHDEAEVAGHLGHHNHDGHRAPREACARMFAMSQVFQVESSSNARKGKKLRVDAASQDERGVARGRYEDKETLPRRKRPRIAMRSDGRERRCTSEGRSDTDAGVHPRARDVVEEGRVVQGTHVVQHLTYEAPDAGAWGHAFTEYAV